MCYPVVGRVENAERVGSELAVAVVEHLRDVRKGLVRGNDRVVEHAAYPLDGRGLVRVRGSPGFHSEVHHLGDERTRISSVELERIPGGDMGGVGYVQEVNFPVEVHVGHVRDQIAVESPGPVDDCEANVIVFENVPGEVFEAFRFPRPRATDEVRMRAGLPLIRLADQLAEDVGAEGHQSSGLPMMSRFSRSTIRLRSASIAGLSLNSSRFSASYSWSLRSRCTLSSTTEMPGPWPTFFRRRRGRTIVICLLRSPRFSLTQKGAVEPSGLHASASGE